MNTTPPITRASETIPEVTEHVDDLVGAIEEIRLLCAVSDADAWRYVLKSDVLAVLDRWCV